MRLVRTTALTTTMLIGSAIAPASPAAAGDTRITSWDSCVISGYVCVAQDHDGGGWMLNWRGNSGFQNIGARGYGDQVSSIRNWTSDRVYLLNYYGPGNCWQHLFTAMPGETYNLGRSNDQTDGIVVNSGLPANLCPE